LDDLQVFSENILGFKLREMQRIELLLRHLSQSALKRVLAVLTWSLKDKTFGFSFFQLYFNQLADL